MPVDLATFQRDFAAAVLSGAESELDHWPGFAVYRNNSTIAAIEALAAAYPTVHKILGEFEFRQIALNFLRSHPPESAVLAQYGAGFTDVPEFRMLSACFPYLADIGLIDRMQVEAHLASDAVGEGLDPARITDAEWTQVTAALHPATRFRWFATPAPSAWIALRQSAARDVAASPRGGEGILLTRPFGAVEATLIDRVGYLLLEGLSQGRSVADAALEAAEAQHGADMGRAFKRLLDSGAIHRFERRETK